MVVTAASFPSGAGQRPRSSRTRCRGRRPRLVGRQHGNEHLDQRVDRHLDQRVDRNLDQRVDRNLDQRVDRNLDKRLDRHVDKRVDRDDDQWRRLQRRRLGEGRMSVFESTCASCHTLAAAGSTGTVGPNLDQLKPSDALLIHQVTNGGGGMPAFGSSLSQTQIKSVALFVSSVAGKPSRARSSSRTTRPRERTLIYRRC